MSKLSDLRNYRYDAGARYSAALAEFRAAYIDLAATDRAMMNGNVGGAGAVSTFPTTPVDLSLLQHPEFAPDVLNEPGANWNAAISKETEKKLKSSSPA